MLAGVTNLELRKPVQLLCTGYCRELTGYRSSYRLPEYTHNKLSSHDKLTPQAVSQWYFSVQSRPVLSVQQTALLIANP